MPGTLEMPPEGKSAGSLNMISTVWVAGNPLSVLRRSDQVMASLRSGTSTSARIASSGGCPGPGVTVSVRQIAEPTKALAIPCPCRARRHNWLKIMAKVDQPGRLAFQAVPSWIISWLKPGPGMRCPSPSDVLAPTTARLRASADGVRGGAHNRARTTMLLRGGQEARIRAAVAAGRNRDYWSTAVDQFGGLNLVTALLLACCDRDVLPHLVGWATLGGAEPVRGFCIENVALLAHVDLGLEVRDLEMVITLLDHFPERHVRRVAVAGHVGGGHAERIGLQLERLLAAEECFAGERVDFRDLLVGHGVAAGRRAAAVDHQERAAAAVRAIVCIREARIDREILA